MSEDGFENRFFVLHNTRSQAVTRIANRTASQHLWGHVTIRYSICHFLLVVLWNEVFYLQLFSRLRAKGIGVTILTFQGHVTLQTHRHVTQVTIW